MYNLNLNLYVEQVNCDLNDSKPSTWENNDEQALKDVVDPNTEFQDSENSGSLTPASPLESYGVPIPSQARALKVKKNLTEHIDQSSCDTFTSQYQTNTKPFFEGLDVKHMQNYSNWDMPQVHAAVLSHPTEMHRAGRNNGRAHGVLEPKVHNGSVGRSSKQLPHHSECFVDMPSRIHKISTVGAGYEQTRQEEQNSCSMLTAPPFSHASTSEQLSWAFRTARDRLETGSNISGCSSRFELESNCSERADTMSTFSDVSGYEDEMYRIRRLLLQDDPPTFLEKHLTHDSTLLPKKQSLVNSACSGIHNIESHDNVGNKECYSQKVQMLCSQLDFALAEKEKYRLALSEAETKTTLEWQQKYQDVLRQKANMEGRLEMVQSEVDTLRNALVGESRMAESHSAQAELLKLQTSLKEMSNKNQELMIQLELSESEKSRWREEAQDSDSANEQLRIQLQELRVDTESKDGAIQGLKMKVADQHVEIQTLLQAKLKSENSLSTVRCEMETLQKSSHWYREQLHICQAAKVKVHQELMTAQANVVSYSHLIERMKGEAENLKLTAMETQDKAVREKDNLMRKLEAIRADMLEREATIMSQLHRDDTTVETIAAKLRTIEESRASESNIVIQDLEHKIDMLKHELKEKICRVESLGSENSQLIIRLTAAQDLINEKELALQNLEIKFNNIEASYNTLSENVNHKDEVMLEAKNEKIILEVALAAAAREKGEVDSAIVTLREDFTRITKSYQSMRTKLNEKERVNGMLEAEIHEMGKLKEQHSEQLAKLKEVEHELTELRAKSLIVNNWEHQLEDLCNQNKELHTKLQEIREAKQYAVDQSIKLQETLTFREEQLVNQTHLFEVHSEELKSRNQIISDLTTDKHSLQEHIETLKTKIGTFEEMYSTTCKEVEFSNSQLARANGVIEQFNILCRGSEQENHELKKLTKELEEALLIPQDITCIDGTTQTHAAAVISTGIQVSTSTGDSTFTKLLEELEVNKKEIEMLKCSLRMSDVEKHEEQRRYESNIRTLLKKVKEHMRGRKAAEKALEEAHSSTNYMLGVVDTGKDVQAEVKRLESEKEVCKRQYDELKKVMEENEMTVLVLEKEMGKLVQRQAGTKVATYQEPGQLAKDVKVVKMNGQVEELEEQVRNQQMVIKELRKQIFMEKRNNSQLRKQVTSLRMGMDTANDVLDSKKVDLGRSEAMGELLRESNSRLQRELEKEQIMHEKSKQDLDKITQELEENLAKEPMLADQMKMLSYHLHQKSQEVSNVQDMMLVLKLGWLTKEEGLKQSIQVLKDEINSLRDELATVRAEKFTLQSQAVDLRAGLQSSRDQNEILQLKLDAYQQGNDKDCGLPDLMSSLPSAPIKYDEVQIAELLNHSTLFPHNKPLSNLQSCLDSLKQEMATLQQEVVAKTSGHSRNNNPIDTSGGVQQV